MRSKKLWESMVWYVPHTAVEHELPLLTNLILPLSPFAFTNPATKAKALALVAGFVNANGLSGNMRFVSNGSSCSTAVCGTYQTIDSHSFLDLNLKKALNENMDVYLVVENVLDSEDIVARAPKDGARSQKPRTMKVGFSYNF